MGGFTQMRHLINLNEKRILENAGDRIPIGLLNIATQVGDTKVYDLNHMGLPDYMDHFVHDKPTAVGISVYTSPSLPEAIHVGETLKGLTRLIAGGHHASAMPETLTDLFDAVVVGHGEDGFKKALEQDGVVHGALTGRRGLDYGLVDLDKYGMNVDGKRYATMITSRGCPFSCSFCGKLERRVSNDDFTDVYHNIKGLKDFDGIYFLDDVFTLREDRMKNILGMTKQPKRVTTRADLLDKSKMKEMVKYGVDWLSLGIESGDNDILKFAGKGMNTRDNMKAVKMANNYGIKTKGFFILGLPGETEETARRTIDFSKRLRDKGLTQADWYFLTPFPGTPIWNEPDRFGINITDKDFTKYLEAGKGAKCFVDTEELKAERIEELVEEAKEEWS